MKTRSCCLGFQNCIGKCEFDRNVTLKSTRKLSSSSCQASITYESTTSSNICSIFRGNYHSNIRHGRARLLGLGEWRSAREVPHWPVSVGGTLYNQPAGPRNVVFCLSTGILGERDICSIFQRYPYGPHTVPGWILAERLLDCRYASSRRRSHQWGSAPPSCLNLPRLEIRSRRPRRMRPGSNPVYIFYL